MYKNFVELLEAYPVASNKKVAAICAHEDHVIEAMIDVHQRYDVQPILIGHEDEIRMLLAKQNCFTKFRIINAVTDEQAVRIAIDLVKAGECDVLFKGLIQTSTMMRAIVNHETGICERGVMSHIALMEVPGLERLLAVTDAALLTNPTGQLVAHASNVQCRLDGMPNIRCLSSNLSLNDFLLTSVQV